jgi:2,3-bisphosphoglycerate-independent phosphoglycerate mutase
MANKPVMLIILDGWGMRDMEDGNAPKLANIPHYTRWSKTLERTVLDASEEAVGLTPGQMGNSEVGHLNLGAGRVVYQDISAIDNAISTGTFQQHEKLLTAFANIKAKNRKLHLIGLLSDGGVHSHERHLYALLEMTKAHNINPVIHIITDGRDTPPNSGIGFVEKLEQYTTQNQHGRISSLSGRYYTMDRDKRWERTQKGYDVILQRQAERQNNSASDALRQSYNEDISDEFVKSVVIGSDATLKVEAGDTLLFYNFRADRMRQIVRAVLGENIEGLHNPKIDDLNIITFTVYEDDYPVDVLFGKEKLKNVLAEVISQHGLTQYHSAETEKYPHVTFFFNGRREEPFAGEDRTIIPSPKVATYDLKPEMSAYELTEATLQRLESHNDDFILINYANPDMVGHTGSLEAAMKAVGTVDDCANKLVEAVIVKGGVALVTADHGNCERMVELATGEPHTYHTTNPVALYVIGKKYYLLRPRGKLADVAPTVLELMDIPQPTEMTGKSLIEAQRE